MRLPLLVLSVLMGAQLPRRNGKPAATNRTLSSRRSVNGSKLARARRRRCGLRQGGTDTVTFANIVGAQGTVLAQEIETANLEKVVEVTTKRVSTRSCPCSDKAKTRGCRMASWT